MVFGASFLWGREEVGAIERCGVQVCAIDLRSEKRLRSKKGGEVGLRW